ncbi:MAG: 50S ribosomal protein L21 [Bacillota bacterium]
MYAVIETGGKQYKVSKGDVIEVEKLPVKVGGKVEIDKVLMIVNGDKSKIGKPYVKNAKAVAKVMAQDKSAKVLVFHYKAKKNIRKRYGHRQPFTRLLIEQVVEKVEEKAGE